MLERSVLEENGTPLIYLRHRGYVLYGVEEASNSASSEIAVEDDETGATADSDRSPQGIAMWNKDISQLELFIRKGTPVTIILDGE